MLNRRILRVKAMQALYSYFLAQESLKSVVQEQLESHYYPDPAKDDFTQADLFTQRRKTATKLYHEFLASKTVDGTGGTDPEIAENVQLHINKYYQEVKGELATIESQMFQDVENLETLYLKLIQLVVEFAHVEKLEKDKKERAHIPKVSAWKYHFIENPVIDDLTKFEEFTGELITHKIGWEDELDLIKSWYKDIVQKDETLIEYQKKQEPSAQEHHEAILHLYKKIIFKNEIVDDYLASINLRWSENKSVIKSLVVKTFQDYEPELDPPFVIREVNRNEEEDMEFFKKLFRETIKREKELDEIIAKKTRNWDISRVATTDRIILRMSLAEMMTFYSIPVKVSINEFIEISKNYSTPKSKQFINGILDVLANELTSEGVIRKSGRGLIDNK